MSAEAVVSVSLADLTTLHAMARTVDKKNVNAHGRDILTRTGELIQVGWRAVDNDGHGSGSDG
jgi:hypothetical protein